MRASFQAPCTSEWQDVELPFEWRAGQTCLGGEGSYRVSFNVSDTGLVAPDLALRTNAMSTRHRIALNGKLLESDETRATDHSPPHLAPAFIEVPPSLLHPGLNELLIRERLEWGGGLSRLYIGPRPGQFTAHENHVARTRTTPQLINAATLAMALFMLSVWLRRRKEETLGLFALVWIPVAIRNYAYYATTSSIPEEVLRGAFLLVNVECSFLLFLVAISTSGSTWPRCRRALAWAAITAPALVCVGVAFERIAWTKAILYPVSIIADGFGVWLLYEYGRKQQRRVALAFALGSGAIVVAAAHDYFAWSGELGMDATYWIPWVSPVLFVCIAVGLMNRMVRALDEAETMAARLETEVKIRTAQLELANIAKSRFIAATSHDLRQPMHALVQYVAHMKRVTTQPVTWSTMEKIEDSVEAMEELLNAVLDFSKITLGSIRPVFRTLNIQEVMQAIDTQIRPFAQDKELRFLVESESGCVHSDPVLLGRVLRNIAHNAVRYTSSGTVRIRARPSGRLMRILVGDSGIGIAAVDKQRVFEDYYQVDNSARDRQRGLGLGLAIVRELADLLGARVRVKSVWGRGSTFAVELPLASNVTAASRHPPVHDAIDHVKGAFVVLIEDDSLARDGMATTLKDFGCRILAKASAAEAINALGEAEFPPQVLISDYRLGAGLTGLEAIALVRQSLQAVYGARFQLGALLVSGDTSPEELRRVEQAGYVMLHKPVRTDNLHLALNNILARRA